MPDDVDGDSPAPEEQDAYHTKPEAGNELTGAKEQPGKSVSLKEPIIFVVLGLFIQIFNVYVGLGLIIAGFIWMFWRIISRITRKR